MSDQDLRISASELKRRISAGEDFTIVDACNPQAWEQAADTPAKRLCPDFRIQNQSSRTVFDRTKAQAPVWRKKLRAHGYQNAWALEGGRDAWKQLGLALERKSK